MQKIKSGDIQDSEKSPSETEVSNDPSEEKDLSEWEKRLEGMN